MSGRGRVLLRRAPWLALAAVGLVLMAIKIVADSEPGLLPLVLLGAGIAGLVLRRGPAR